MKPPFRWVGGKTKLLPVIGKYLPHTVNRYFEPMMGGGALFWHYGDVADQCFLNDINYPLMNAYAMLRDHFFDVHCAAMAHDGVDYGALRCMFNEAKKVPVHILEAPERLPDRVLLAAMFCMLMGTCFNGLYRENRAGGFNTPQGSDSKKNPHKWNRVDWEGLKKAGKALRDATLSCGDFLTWPWGNVELPGLGDVVFYDPPYFGEFSDYHSARFDRIGHSMLCDQAQAFARDGATVIVCGSNNQWSWSIYGKPTEVITVRRTVGASLRGDVTEALYVYKSG